MPNTDNINNTRNSFSTNTNTAIDAAQRENFVQRIESDRAEGQTVEQIAATFHVRVESVSAYFAAVDTLMKETRDSDAKEFDATRRRRD